MEYKTKIGMSDETRELIEKLDRLHEWLLHNVYTNNVSQDYHKYATKYDDSYKT